MCIDTARNRISRTHIEEKVYNQTGKVKACTGENLCNQIRRKVIEKKTINNKNLVP